jgi:hypothetical protein
MNKNDARKIAETITNEQLQAMFDRAKSGIKDWERVSAVNKGMTKGAAWNILAANFDASKTWGVLAKKNMVWEFGDFLPDELKPSKSKRPIQVPVHQSPKFHDNPPKEIDRSCGHEFEDLYTDGAGRCFSDADPGL